MKVGFGQGIALIQIDRTFARHGVFGRFEVRRVAETARRRAEIRHGMRAGFLHHERLRAFTRCTQLGARLTQIGNVGVFHQPTHGAGLVLIPPHCSEPESAEHDDQQRNGRPPILGHPIDPRSGRRRLILDRRRGRRPAEPSPDAPSAPAYSAGPERNSTRADCRGPPPRPRAALRPAAG